MSTESTVSHDQLCMQCGYNLRGLPRTGACPECGHPVAMSLQGDWLRFAERSWLHRVARGCATTRYIGFMLLVVATMAATAAAPKPVASSTIDAIVQIGRLCLAGFIFGIAAGVWMMTSTEPRHQDRDVRSRVVLRSVAVLAMPAFAVWSMTFRRQLPMFGVGPVWQEFIVQACFIVVWLQILATMHIRASLHRRCLEAQHDRGTQQPAWGGALAFALILLSVYWIGPIRWNDAGSWTMPLSKSQRSLMFISFIGWLIAVHSLARLRPLIRQELEASEKFARDQRSALEGERFFTTSSHE